ncbi:hypothetical protein AB4K08_01030 [Serratia fonticola]|uniref:hypothetical protein n=1 Tax=Serratia fonticola TaxID=47917 RepID=UPI0034C66661
MKIVDRKTFLSLPKNTLFSVFESYSFGPLNIKGDSLSNDYFYQEIHDSIDVKNSDEFISALSSAKEKGTSLGLEFDLSGFNGFAYTHLIEGKPPLLLIGVFLHEPQILAHEACHTAFEICNHVGVPTPNDSQNETFCYLVQRIMHAFMPHITSE